MDILLTANTDWFLFNFRRALIEALLARGDRVSIACPDGEYRPRLQALGARWFPVTIDRRGMNPLKDLASVRRHRAVLDAVRPDLVHNFTIKSVIAVGLAARVRRFDPIAIVNSFEGLGYLFNSRAASARLAKPVIRRLLGRLNARRNTVATVLNADDLARFVQQRIAPKAHTVQLDGAGVDLARFAVPDVLPTRFTILFASRLLHDKGVGVLVSAVEQLRASGRSVRLRIAGAADPGNPDAVDAAEIVRWNRLPDTEVLGHRSDVDRLIAESSVVVLVSRHEGLPTILAEAGACGVPVITSAQGGCREIVTDGVNGLVVPTDDAPALAAAIERLMDNPALARRLGLAGRRIVEERFAVGTINAQILALYDRLLAARA